MAYHLHVCQIRSLASYSVLFAALPLYILDFLYWHYFILFYFWELAWEKPGWKQGEGETQTEVIGTHPGDFTNWSSRYPHYVCILFHYACCQLPK